MEEEVVKKYKCLMCPNSDHYNDASCFEYLPKRRRKSRTEYKCTYCSYLTNIRTQLKKHVLLHKCIDAIEKGTLRLNTDTNNVQTLTKQYKPVKSSDIRALRLFRELKTELRSYQCPKCSFWSKKPYLLKEHVTEHHYKLPKPSHFKATNCGTYKCPLCRFSTRDIKKHLLNHEFGMRRSNKSCRCPNLGCRFGGSPAVKKKLQIKKPVYVKMEIEDFYRTLDKNTLLDHSYVQRKCRILVKCWICNYQTSRKYCLKKHMRIHRESSTTTAFKCYLCTEKQQFTKRLSDLTHQLWFEKSCFLCSCETKNSRELQDHLMLHLNSDEIPSRKLYNCLVCEFKTYELGLLREHVFTHLMTMPILIYKCDKCDYVTNWQYMLSRHESSHLTVERRLDYDEYFLPKSLKTKNPHVCKFWDPLSILKKSVKSEVDVVDLTTDEDQNQSASSNSKNTAAESSSEDALTSLLIKQSQEDFLLACENKNIMILKCQHCTFYASDEQELADHMFKHLKTEEVLQCPSCDFRTDRTDFFKQHKIKHIVKYLCPVCNVEKKRHGSFIAHMRMHKDYNSGEFYNCVYCDHTTVSQIQFKVHVMEHITDDVGLRCFKCHSSFNSKKVLVNHLTFHARVHSINPFIGAVYDSPLLQGS